MKVRPKKYRKWGPVTCLETGEVYATPNEAAKAIGLKTSDMVRKSILLERDCKSLHFVDGRLTGDALEKARHELEMQARQNLDRGVPSEYEIGVPVRIIKPGLITCMPVPARGGHHEHRHRRHPSADSQDTGRTGLLLANR
ncbi:hypothetical protein [Faecalibaculum rodentium]|uniref:hypothetical protein n=1 Tax=Faecalibaculum rodentium TaxID=1702221 RepID=UPI002731392D|nr:hypothetical protein [Faecalibaculum rodentium]